MMPETYAELIPINPEPIYKYTAEGASKCTEYYFKLFLKQVINFELFCTGSLPGTTVAHELVVAIRRKCTAEEVLTILNTLPSENEDASGLNSLKIDVFVQTLLNLGSKSFSHSFAAIGKFHQVFKV